MKNKIAEFNNLYKPAIEHIKQVQWTLRKYCIEHALSFINEHHIKIDNKPELIQYPIPTVICKLVGIQTKIGMDIAVDSSYIGFVKFTLKKEEFETFDFEALKPFRFEIYGEHYCKEIVDLNNLEEIKNYTISPKENFVYIKIRIETLEQVNNIIDNFCTMPQKEFSMISYVCDCGTRITIDEHNGQCPTCGKDSPHRRKFKTKCPACETNTFKDKYGHGECENCGWLFDKMSTKQRSRVIYPNLISLNKAKILYKQGKKLEPNLDDFLDGLFMYSEMVFSYNNVEYEVFLRANRNIVLCSLSIQQEYTTREDFKNKANINGVLLKDIWQNVINADYM